MVSCAWFLADTCKARKTNTVDSLISSLIFRKHKKALTEKKQSLIFIILVGFKRLEFRLKLKWGMWRHSSLFLPVCPLTHRRMVISINGNLLVVYGILKWLDHL